MYEELHAWLEKHPTVVHEGGINWNWLNNMTREEAIEASEIVYGKPCKDIDMIAQLGPSTTHIRDYQLTEEDYNRMGRVDKQRRIDQLKRHIELWERCGGDSTDSRVRLKRLEAVEDRDDVMTYSFRYHR